MTLLKTKKIVDVWVNKNGTCRCCGYLPHLYKKEIKPRVERARIKEYIRKELEDI